MIITHEIVYTGVGRRKFPLFSLMPAFFAADPLVLGPRLQHTHKLTSVYGRSTQQLQPDHVREQNYLFQFKLNC